MSFNGKLINWVNFKFLKFRSVYDIMNFREEICNFEIYEEYKSSPNQTLITSHVTN